MAARKSHSLLTLFLLIVLFANLIFVGSARADGETPTEPPAASEAATESPVPAASDSVEATPVPELDPVQIPTDSEVVVLDGSGGAVPLASQEAAEIVGVTDPMWCPDGVAPGGAGCTTNFGTITDLIADMKTNTANYTSHGIIYFTAAVSESLALNTTSLGNTDFNTLNDFNITLQGGWNGLNDGSGYALSGQTDFGANTIRIGSSTNPWVGNVLIKDISFNGVSTDSALRVFTTSGDITLDNVDVLNQGGGFNTALLTSTSGDITIQHGSTFSGNGIDNRGVSAVTAGSGSITVSDSTFSNIQRAGTASYEGAQLSAPTVTLTNVIATNNDGSGILIENANVVTLNNVTASSNGTTNSGSGVFINGNPGSRLIIIGGAFNDNRRYGIQLGTVANTTVYVQSNPTCAGNRVSCYNTTPIFDNTPPVITPIVSGTAGSGGWYTSDVSVSWSFDDAESGVLSSSGCALSSLTAETAGTTLTCSVANKAGLSSSASVTVKIDKTSPVMIVPADITKEATLPAGAVVSYSPSISDNLDPSVNVSCLPASGSSFSLGATVVTCLAADAAGNTSSGNFQVTVQDTTAPQLQLPADFSALTKKTGSVVKFAASATDLVDGLVPVSCVPASGSRFALGSTVVSCSATDAHGNTSTGKFEIQLRSDGESTAVQESASPVFVLPLTGGELLDLNCNSVFWAVDIKVSFINLCDQQASIQNISAGDLPAGLPEGLSFAMGLSVDVLNNSQALHQLPGGSNIQIDFPVTGGTGAQLAVLYWNGSAWIDVSKQSNLAPPLLSVTTDKPGTFVLASK